MKLERFWLKAFGPFTDRELHFSSTSPGLHIVFGPNEAGKSSSLRALHALLFGFSQQSPDNFLHSYEQLLVGGEVVRSDGQRLEFWRRKRRVGDLLDAAHNPLGSDVLSPFLQGMQPDIFASLFGLDHERLVAGGREMLAEKGDVGQALFGAGAGLASLRTIVASLQQEAEELYKPTGQKPLINLALRRYREIEREIREASLSVQQYQEVSKRYEQLEARRLTLESERSAREKERMRLERMLRVIPELHELSSRRRRLEELGEVAVLPPGFAEQYAQLLQDEQQTIIGREELQRQLQSLQERLETVVIDEKLLGAADRIDNLYQRLGEYRKGQQDRPERNGMRQRYRGEAAQLLEQLRPDLSLDTIEELRPILTRKRTIGRLSKEHATFGEQLRRSAKAMHGLEIELQTLREQLQNQGPAVSVERLRQFVKQARQAGDIDEDIRQKQHEIQLLAEKSLAEQRRLGLYHGELATILSLALPLAPTVQRFAEQYQDNYLARKRNDDAHGSIIDELTGCQEEMRRLDFDDSLPSEMELRQARTTRDEEWQLIRANWLEDQGDDALQPRYQARQQLAADYESSARDADTVADKLRLEADRVASAGAIRARIAILEARLSRNTEEKNLLAARQEEFAQEWQKLWQPLGIAPLSPAEMLDWLRDMTSLRSLLADQLLKMQKEAAVRDQQRRQLRSQILAELAAAGETGTMPGEELAPVVLAAETLLERQQEQTARLEKLQERIGMAEAGLLTAREEHRATLQSQQQWQQQWHLAVAGLGLGPGAAPEEGEDRLEMLERCFGGLREAETLQKRITGIDRDAKVFIADTHSLLQDIAADLLALAPEASVSALRRRLGQAQETKVRYSELANSSARLQQDLVGLDKRLSAIQTQKTAMAGLAGCTVVEDVPLAIDRYRVATDTQQKITDTEARLARVGGGLSVDALFAETAGVEFDGLATAIAGLKREVEEELNPEMNRVSQEIGETRAKLLRMDGGSRAADLAVDRALESAGLKRLVDRYVTVKLAARLMQQEIENYRQRHQGPLLALGSQYFSTLTRGSFVGLRSDVNEKGELVLVGEKEGARRLAVTEMSSGTRDQLYLALRFATLSWRLEKHEPFPFIVDDILINFDDDRAQATLEAMAELSSRNQIILFTHHQRLVEQARAIGNDHEVFIHNL